MNCFRIHGDGTDLRPSRLLLHIAGGSNDDPARQNGIANEERIIERVRGACAPPRLAVMQLASGNAPART